MTDSQSENVYRAAERLARAFPNLCVVDDDGAIIPLSTAMFVRVAMCALDVGND